MLGTMNPEDRQFITEELKGLEGRLGEKIEAEIAGLARLTQEEFATVHEELEALAGDVKALESEVSSDHEHSIGTLASEVDRLKQHVGLH